MINLTVRYAINRDIIASATAAHGKLEEKKKVSDWYRYWQISIGQVKVVSGYPSYYSTIYIFFFYPGNVSRWVGVCVVNENPFGGPYQCLQSQIPQSTSGTGSCEISEFLHCGLYRLALFFLLWWCFAKLLHKMSFSTAASACAASSKYTWSWLFATSCIFLCLHQTKLIIQHQK